jgi:hypothetical protein
MFGSPYRRLAAVIAAAIVIGVVAGLARAQRESMTLTDRAHAVSLPTPQTDVPVAATAAAAPRASAPPRPKPTARYSSALRPERRASRAESRDVNAKTAAARKPPARSTARSTATHAFGEIEVKSTPSGAKVLVDKRSAGTTPLLLKRQSAGKHAIRIDKRGYRISTSTVVVRDGKRTKLNIRLNKNK